MINQNNSVEVTNLSKKFNIRYTTIYGGVAKSGTKQVLDNLTFDVKKGEVLGIIGKNGSGKSTLLKLITDIMKPDSGSIALNGKVSSILELGMGFDPESSGRDNIRMKCGLYGLSNSEINACIDEIILFSELGEQIDYPLRTYSSGMTAKLAFSVLMYVKSDILIIDEVLSVGDAGFNSKCKLAFQKMRKAGRSVILASHNLSTLEELCDRVMWIDGGRVREIGEPTVTCYRYKSDLINSIDTVLKNAESGDVISINRAGEMYRDGISVEKDLINAEKYFETAANLGSTDAQINLANIRIDQGRTEDALHLLEKAAVAGNTNAVIALMQLKEGNVKKDEFMECLRKIANEGNSRAMKLLADILFQGNLVSKNIEEAVYWYTRCSEQYNNLAEYQLGICYRDGLGVQKDPLKAVEYLTRSSDHGYMRARGELANMYRRGIGVTRDMAECIKWYEVAANAGDVGSMYQLGLIYRDGAGVNPDKIKSEQWFKQYSQQTLAGCEMALGDIIRQGYSGARKAECIKWYVDSAARGNINAMMIVANIHREGLLVPLDSSMAFDYYSQAASKLNHIALYEQGLAYLKGEGVAKNDMEAINAIRKSALIGNTRAMMLYAHMIRNMDLFEDQTLYTILMNNLSEYENYVARLENESNAHWKSS